MLEFLHMVGPMQDSAIWPVLILQREHFNFKKFPLKKDVWDFLILFRSQVICKN